MQSASSPASGPAYETVGGCTGVLGLSLTLIFTQSLWLTQYVKYGYSKNSKINVGDTYKL